MSATDSIEIEASTVEEAIRAALKALEAEEDDVSIQVLATPRTGLLGLGARQAKVKVTRRPPEGSQSAVAAPPSRPVAPPARPAVKAPAAPPSSGPIQPKAPTTVPTPAPARAVATTPASSAEQGATPRIEHEEREGGPERQSASPEEQAREAMALVSKLLELMGEQAEIKLAAIEPDSLEIEIKGDGSGLLIGRHGQTLDALEYLINRLLSRQIADAIPVSLDIEAYRARRRQQLERMALSIGERAKREHKTVSIDPMPPRDRRIIHLALKDDPLVVTRSHGTGYLRALEVSPVDARRERGEHNDRERAKERPQLGQQGGFKHGQKRIV